ncbi:MAG: ABC transporter permease [Clostridia bacterium]|nr:ABC transporter permease [Clostridia bacterium]
MTAIFKREFKSYFSTPIGFIVIAAFYFFLGLFFSITFGYGSPYLEQVVMAMSTIVVFAMPILTMRLMSEDKRQKVDQALLTAPVGLTSIVMGKFLAAMSVFAIGFAPTVIFEIIIMTKVSVNILGYLYALLGMLLLAGALTSIGMFISSLTESTVIAAIISFIINILVLYMTSFASMIKVEWIANIINRLAFITVFENFGGLVFSVADIIYFLSIICVFIFLCVRSLEKKRWA